MTPKTDLDYVASKLDYKTKEIIDLYTLRIRRQKEESRELTLEQAVKGLGINGNS